MNSSFTRTYSDLIRSSASVFFFGCVLVFCLAGCRSQNPQLVSANTAPPIDKSKVMLAPQVAGDAVQKISKTDAEWRASLTKEQYYICRQKGTEPAFTGSFWNEHRSGIYRCACCGQIVFRSEDKFESGTGWPSFTAPAAANYVEAKEDSSFGMNRTEVLCARCGSHLGHVFQDGPRPTGLRYCINSAALQFEAAKNP